MSNVSHDSTDTVTVRFRIERSQLSEEWGEFEAPVRRHTTVVDALEWIKSRLDASLMFRHSCHHGSCGTCGMVINGERRLACTTNVMELLRDSAEVDGPSAVEIRPLRTMRHLGDLAVDPTPLFRDFPVAAGYIRPSEANKGSLVPEEIERYERFENCIECGLCVSACPVISLRGFMGPAALAAYNREIEKRPERAKELLPIVDTEEGVWGCDRHLACSAVCPTGVYPAKHIAVLQRKIKKERGE
ncbi:MAG: 2Fe-2S iron-sulfur cluster-binding protein [Spirochaetales bacterium]|nr:2Fe-2S iron-sulfur cluster-binding protein [Spirochaetales bacterium]